MSEPSVRAFDYEDDKSSKFWAVSVAGVQVAVRCRKSGTQGQS